ncbi:MAG: insulinase family protein [Thermoguttaceae bacterium]|nr:insulinase family protein [Thermoguttaceae bacterium]MDW8080113.1 pitrilysin family protein [Thermoguttaceae bacterium]
MAENALYHEFPNGLTLIGEPMRWVESVGVSIRLQAGSIYDPPEKAGLAHFTTEMAMRGAGARDSRALVQELGLYGIHHAAGTGTGFAKFGFATVSARIAKGFEIFADVVRRPQLPASQVENVRQGILQELRGLADEPAALLVRELKRVFYPYPIGRPTSGDEESVARITLSDIQEHHARYYQPDGGLIAVAGKFNWEELVDLVGDFFGDWQGQKPPEVRLIPSNVRYRHCPHPSEQVQIGVAFPGPAYSHGDFFQAWAAAAVLGHGSGSRLFRELREKRGLCYGCGASYHSGRLQGGTFCYASTSADRAQKTLDVLLGEIRQLAEGIQPEELHRIKATIKSAMIMSQESSMVRCGAIARDWVLLRRVRPIEELRRIIDDLSAESINAFLAANPPRNLVIVTVGPKELEVNGEL